MNDIIRGRKSPDTSKKTRRQGFSDVRLKMAREDAAERQAGYDALSTVEKIARLDRRLGANVGAAKERAKLKAVLEAEIEAEEQKKSEAAKAKEVSKKKK